MEMKNYYGAGIILAASMTKKEYALSKDSKLNEDEDQEGMAISADKNGQAKIFWVPLSQFNKNYVSEIIPALPKTELIDYQQRVVDEYTELMVKINKLETFLSSKPENVEDLELLNLQLTAMKTYANILAHRINNF
jgi:hypothetical protein